MKASTHCCHQREQGSCKLTARDVLKFAASLILPLVLGIFTAVITLHQQNAALKQRLEDRQLAENQREQDLNISRIQRLEDRLLAREQREQDLNISRDQREQDRQTAKLQRDQDKKLADENLVHDKILAENKMRDDLLVRYMNDISQLLKENNGSLTTDPITAFIVRVKTLTIIRQLDPIRNTHLIRFLYDANQLTNRANPIDLSNAELDCINMTVASVFQFKIHNLSLAGAYLRNASFSKLDLSNSNFSKSQLDDADLKGSVLVDTDFSDAHIVRSDFSDTKILRARFNGAYSRRTKFIRANAFYAIFTDSSLKWATFNRCSCNYADFTNADLEKAEFEFAQLKNSTFVGAKVVRTVFSNANMESANLSNSRMKAAEFLSIHGEQAVFARAEIHECCFFKASTRYADMNYADLKDSNFTEGSLFAATLAYANLMNVKFNGTDFRQVNLSYSEFGLMDESQLKSAISLRGVRLANNSVITRDWNLIKNGDAHCNIPIDTHWYVKPKNSISIVPDESKPDNCIFFSSSSTSSTMSQNVSLFSFKETNLYRQLIAVVTLKCGGDNQTFIRITDVSEDNVIANVNVKESIFNTIRFHVVKNYRFEVSIIFGSNTNYSWCDDIEFTLESLPKL